MVSLKKNYVYSVISQVLMIVLPVITTPYLSRVLGADNLGIYNYALSIVNYFILFGCVGLNLYGQREIAYCKENKAEYSKVFFELLIIRLVTITIASLVFVVTVVRNSQYPLCYLLLGIEIIASLFDISWLFQGLENFKIIAIRNIIIKLLSIACVFIFVKTKNDLWIFILCYAMSMFLGNISLWFNLSKVVVKVKFSTLHPWHHMGPVLIMFLPQVATNVYTQLDKTMIGLLTNHNYEEVSFYSQAENLVKLTLTVITSTGGVMLSRIAVVFSKDNKQAIKDYIEKAFSLMFFLGWPMAFGVAAVAEDFVPWFFGEGFDKVAPCMIGLAPLIVIIGTSNVLGIQYLLPVNKMKQYTISVVVGMLVNFTFNMLLIPKYNSIGAVIGTLIAETAVSLTQFIFVRDVFTPSVLLKGTKSLIAAALMGACVFYISIYLPATIWSTMIEIVVGVLIYVLVLTILKDSFLKNYVWRKSWKSE